MPILRPALALPLAAALLALPAHASGDKALTPAQITWPEKGPAVLDQSDEYGVRIMRVQIPANKELQPHGPKEGYFFVTVISGTLQLGFGTTYDAAKLQTLPPGSVFTHPASQQHFARTGDEPVVLQITSIKPPKTAGATSETAGRHNH